MHHVHIHTYIHVHKHAHTHAHTHAYAYTYIHTLFTSDKPHLHYTNKLLDIKITKSDK